MSVMPAAWSDAVGPWIGIKTYHFSGDTDKNEQNNLIGIRYNRWFAARFDNSFNEPSWAVGYALWQRRRPFLGQYLDNWHYTMRLSPGIAYGYGDRLTFSVAGFTPGVIPSVGLEWSVSSNWLVGSDLLYIWTDKGGVLLQGIHLAWQW